LLKLITLILFTSSPALAWWCEGHQVVGLIASKHLSANAQAAVAKLLKENPDGVLPSCTNSPDDPLAVASTWADDVKKSELTSFWHYMDIPLGLKKGDPEAYCEPIGPSVNGGPRPGCILSALRYAVNVLHSEKETDSEKAKALRYLIHLVGDLHQPLHTTANNDQGGNCTPVQFFDDPKITNLHSVWDGMMFNRNLAAKNQTVASLAATLDQQYELKRKGWIKNAPEFDKWAWEGHILSQNFVYGKLEQKPPIEPYDPKPVCKVEQERFGALHIRTADSYETAAAPIIDEQLAKAGYRLAEILNVIFG
jgi:S1/P1 Nuclease